MTTLPPTHCSFSRPARVVSVEPLIVKVPWMQVVSLFAVMPAASPMVTFPGVTVPDTQPAGVISVLHVPARHIGLPVVDVHVCTLPHVVPHDVSRFRLVSQNVFESLSHSRVPAAQGAHTPPRQA